MPRMPKKPTPCAPCVAVGINASDDIKLKFLEDKIMSEVDTKLNTKQNALEAGDHIEILAGQGTGGKDIISYTGTSPEPGPEPEPTTQLTVYIYEGESPLEGED